MSFIAKTMPKPGFFKMFLEMESVAGDNFYEAKNVLVEDKLL
jgi:hypothetical protein